MEIIQDLQQLTAFDLTPGQIIRNLAVALACGLLIAAFYRLTIQYRSGYRTFAGSLVTLAMITAIVIMVIENNLARAFGLVGAMSIIRFRTAVKDIQDIVFIFFALAVGMGAGVGLYSVTFIGTFAVGGVVLVLSKLQSAAGRRREYLLQFTYAPSPEEEPSYLPVLRRYCRRHHLVNSRAPADGGDLELAFYIVLKELEEHDELVRALAALARVRGVNLFFDAEEF